MDRRTLLKSLASLAAIPVTIKGVEAKAVPLEKGKKYLFLVRNDERWENIQTMANGLLASGIDGAIYGVDDVNDSLKIYEIG
jgi:hypothetical protein